MRKLFRRFLGDEAGATAIEYGLICALIFVVILTAVTAFGQTATGVFITVSEAVVGAMNR